MMCTGVGGCSVRAGRQSIVCRHACRRARRARLAGQAAGSTLLRMHGHSCLMGMHAHFRLTAHACGGLGSPGCGAMCARRNLES